MVRGLYLNSGGRGLGVELGGLVVENVTIVYAFCTPESFGEHFEEVYTLATEIRDEMKQEAVTLEYNGQVKFV